MPVLHLVNIARPSSDPNVWQFRKVCLQPVFNLDTKAGIYYSTLLSLEVDWQPGVNSDSLIAGDRFPSTWHRIFCLSHSSSLQNYWHGTLFWEIYKLQAAHQQENCCKLRTWEPSWWDLLVSNFRSAKEWGCALDSLIKVETEQKWW